MLSARCTPRFEARSFLAAAAAIAALAWHAPARADDPAPAAAPEKKLSDYLKIEGLFDGYYSFRFKNGGKPLSSNELRAFDVANGSFMLGYTELALTTQFDDANIRIDLGYGPGADLASFDTNPTDESKYAVSSVFKQIQQAYATFPIKKVPGFRKSTFDFGKFTTWAGAEVIEAKDNPMYSRSMLFLTGPYTHTGARFQGEVNDLLTVKVALVNGWETINDNNNNKSFAVSLALTLPSKTAISVTTYQGKETGKSSDWRQFYDLVVAQQVGKQLTLNLNSALGTEGDGTWYGASLFGVYTPVDSLKLTLRGEYFSDNKGLRTGFVDSSGNGAPLSIAAGTLTVGVPMTEHGELRLEGRFDSADKEFFVGGTSKTQATAQFAALAWF
jgi:hypothetical protein